MKKNVFLKALAGMATIAVLGASTLVGVSAADTAKLVLSDETGMAGDTVTIAISVENNPGLEGIGGKIKFDEALTLESTKAGTMVEMFTVNKYPDSITFAGAAMEVSEDSEGTIGLIDFTIPEDAEPGTVYEISWIELDDYSNAEGSVNFDEEDLINGSITVGGATTTPPAPPATTTPATEDEAPKTGASTKGIAATSAVLLAAACSAVALKKKRD
jgi:hypothetical protein